MNYDMDQNNLLICGPQVLDLSAGPIQLILKDMVLQEELQCVIDLHQREAAKIFVFMY